MDTHRKIELQSPADLTYLTTLLRAAATQRLNNALPPSPPASNSAPPSPDAYRAKVEELVESFVQEVLGGLRRNVSINGLDVVPDTGDEGEGIEGVYGNAEESIVEKEEFEPYDEKLRERVAAAVKKRDDLISKISKQRRTAPKVAAELHQKALQAEIEAQDRAWAEQEKAAGTVDERQLVEVDLKRQEEMQRSWERAVEGLGRLKGGLGETRARLERAGVVVGYLEGGKTVS